MSMSTPVYCDRKVLSTDVRCEFVKEHLGYQPGAVAYFSPCIAGSIPDDVLKNKMRSAEDK